MKRAAAGIIISVLIAGCATASRPAAPAAAPGDAAVQQAAPTVAPRPAVRVPVWAAASWQVTTVPSSQHGGPGAGWAGLAAAPDGTLYWQLDHAVFRLAPGGQPELFAYLPGGVGSAGLVADGAGYLYAADGNQVLRIDQTGSVTVWAGSGETAFADATGTAAGFVGVNGLCGTAEGTLYVTEQMGRIRKIDPQGVVTTVAGLTPVQRDTLFQVTGDRAPGFTDGGPGHLTALDSGIGPCTVDGAGNLYFVEKGIRRMAPDGTVSWVAGNPWYEGYADGAAAEAQFRKISALSADEQGNLWIADAGNQRIRLLTADGHVYTVAGGGLDGTPDKWGHVGAYTGGEADGLGPDARLNQPAALALSDGQLYVAEAAGRRLRVVSGNPTPYPAGKAVAPIPGSGLAPARNQLGQVAPGQVTVAYALYTPIKSVSLKVDGLAVTETGPGLFTATWEATGGAHTLQAGALLPDGRRIDGAAFTINVDPGAADQNGVHYTLIAPGYNSLVRGMVRLILVGDGIDLELRVDGVTLAKGSSRLLTATWDSTAVPDGNHIFEIGHYIPEQGQMWYDPGQFVVRNGALPSQQQSEGKPELTVYLLGRPYTYTTGAPKIVEDNMPLLPCLETLRYLQVEANWDQAQHTITTRNGNGRQDSLNLDTGAVTVTTDPRWGPASWEANKKPVVEGGVVLCSMDFITDAAEVGGGYNPESQIIRMPWQ